ncbi:MAG: trigger factor [Nitrospirae bacterium]|nr:trigger factor [Nitrospirota bacterium]
MLKGVEEISSTTKRLKINIPSDIIEGEIIKAYDKLRASVKIPGFRPGKVPQAILEKKFAKDVQMQVIERVVPEYYSKALQEAEIAPVTYPNIEEKLELVRNQPLSFTVTVEVKPKIGNLKYEGIELKERTFSVEDAEVESAIKGLQESRALFQVSEEPIKEDDMVIVDYDALADGEPVKELSAKGYPIILSYQGVPKEFSEALLGKKQGDTADVTMHFEDTHANKAVAGKDVLFKVSVTEAKKKVLPELNDEFAKGVGLKDMEELKKKTHDDIYKGKKHQTEMQYKKELLNLLISSHDFDVPPSMLREELELLVYKAKEAAKRKGEALKGEDELRKEHESAARENVKGVLILEAIGRKEKVEVTEQEVNKLIEEIAEGYNISVEEVKKFYLTRDGSLDSLKIKLYGDKVLDFVLEKAAVKAASSD